MTPRLDLYCKTHKVWLDAGGTLTHIREANDSDCAVCELDLAVRYPPLADPEE